MTETRETSAARVAGAGVAGGVGASLVGYLVTYLLVSGVVRESVARQFLDALGGDAATWKVVGWIFFNAHGVTTTVPGLLGTSSVNFVAEAEAVPAALYLVPPVCLLAAGALAAAGSHAPTLSAGAKAGVSVAAGYVVVAVGVAVGDATAGPDLVTATLLAGLVYPVVFGGVGGSLAAVARERRGGSRSRSR